jgi:hypothetical protein
VVLLYVRCWYYREIGLVQLTERAPRRTATAAVVLRKETIYTFVKSNDQNAIMRKQTIYQQSVEGTKGLRRESLWE